jgi:hypothetical protein
VAARYASTADLLIGDITFTTSETDKFVNFAADEMDSELGVMYVIPLSGVDGAAIPAHVLLTLKRCNALIASGRLILSRAAGGEGDTLHAYGKSLVDEGKSLLCAMADGTLTLSGVLKLDAFGSVDSGGNAPSIQQGDATSGVDAFYSWLTAGPYDAVPSPGSPWWGPG